MAVKLFRNALSKKPGCLVYVKHPHTNTTNKIYYSYFKIQNSGQTNGRPAKKNPTTIISTSPWC